MYVILGDSNWQPSRQNCASLLPSVYLAKIMCFKLYLAHLMLTVWTGVLVKPEVMPFEIKDKLVLSTYRRRDVVAFKILLHEHLWAVSAGMFDSPCRLGSIRNPGHRKTLAIRAQFSEPDLWIPFSPVIIQLRIQVAIHLLHWAAIKTKLYGQKR